MAERAYISPAVQRWRRWTDGPLIVFAIGSLPLLLVELKRADLTSFDRHALDAVNVLVLVVFLVDYVVELSLASDRRAYVRYEWSSLLIVVAQALAVVPALAAFGVFRVFRGAPALRAAAVLVRVVAVGGAAASQGRAVLRRHAARFALGLATLTWVTAAAAFTMVEDVGEGRRVGSFFDAVWWAAATITTVGYGDIAPVTFAGRCVGILTMVVGIATFAVVTAKVAEFLVRGDVEAPPPASEG